VIPPLASHLEGAARRGRGFLPASCFGVKRGQPLEDRRLGAAARLRRLLKVRQPGGQAAAGL